MNKLWAWPLLVALVTFEVFGTMIVFLLIMGAMVLLGYAISN
jgi:uncharacterized integral membrane protein